MKRQLKVTAIDFDSNGKVKTVRGTYNRVSPTHTNWDELGLDKVD